MDKIKLKYVPGTKNLVLYGKENSYLWKDIEEAVAHYDKANLNLPVKDKIIDQVEFNTISSIFGNFLFNIEKKVLRKKDIPTLYSRIFSESGYHAPHYYKEDLIEHIKNNNVYYGSNITLIPHVVNDIGVFGAGFAKALADNFPTVKEEYVKANLKLGDLFLSEIPTLSKTFIVHMCAQSGTISSSNPHPLDYDALKACMKQIGQFYGPARDYVNIMAPKFGSGLAGGDWNKIEEMINWLWVRESLNVNIFEL